MQVKEAGYVVTDKCIGCKLCYAKCPQKCIDITRKPVALPALRQLLRGLPCKGSGKEMTPA